MQVAPDPVELDQGRQVPFQFAGPLAQLRRHDGVAQGRVQLGFGGGRAGGAPSARLCATEPVSRWSDVANRAGTTTCSVTSAPSTVSTETRA